MGYNEGGSKRQVHSNKCLHLKKMERSHTNDLIAQVIFPKKKKLHPNVEAINK